MKHWRIGLVTLALLFFVLPGISADDEGFQNLQVFDADIEKDELKATMKGFTKQLGVKCSFCHVPDEYHLDENEHKNVARAMIRMMQNLNENAETFLPGGKNEKLRCWTCHRGQAEVEEYVPEDE